MKPYGLSRRESGDTDWGGCKAYGRTTRLLSPENRPRSLRGKKIRETRRIFKRRARNEGKASCREEL